MDCGFCQNVIMRLNRKSEHIPRSLLQGMSNFIVVTDGALFDDITTGRL